MAGTPHANSFISVLCVNIIHGLSIVHQLRVFSEIVLIHDEFRPTDVVFPASCSCNLRLISVLTLSLLMSYIYIYIYIYIWSS
jgi:hypothetical protein